MLNYGMRIEVVSFQESEFTRMLHAAQLVRRRKWVV